MRKQLFPVLVHLDYPQKTRPIGSMLLYSRFLHFVVFSQHFFGIDRSHCALEMSYNQVWRDIRYR